MPFAPARADLVTDWNALALNSLMSAEAPYAARDLAILNVAIYNAGESLRGGYTTYGFGNYAAPTSGPEGASIEAAMATAANQVMVALYGANTSFTSLYNAQMSTIASSPEKDAGEAWGRDIASQILAWREFDGAAAAGSTAYSPVGTVGYWLPSGSSSAVLPGWGNVDTFAIGSTVGFTTTLPGASVTDYLQSSQYAADFNQVKDLGAAQSSTRGFDQTNQAYFWAAGTGTVKITGMWNQIATDAAATAGLDVFDTARLFAAMNVAMADAGIAAFAQAYDVQFWRPDAAIANGGDGFFDTDGNPATMGDGDWLPLINTPSLPEYASMQGAFSAAAAAVLAEYLGDSVNFSLGSDINGDGSVDMTRDFSSFSQAANEAAMSGIYAGTQFGTSVADSQTLGANVGDYVVSNNFALVPEPSGMLLVFLGCGLGLISRRRARR